MFPEQNIHNDSPAAQFQHLEFSLGSTIDQIFWTERVGSEWQRYNAKIVEVDYDGNFGHAIVVVANEWVIEI